MKLVPADLEGVFGGQGIPPDAFGTALGMGLQETVKQRSNIGNAFNSFNEGGWNPIYNAISGFNGYMSQGRVGEGRWEPSAATANSDGSINQPQWIPNGP